MSAAQLPLSDSTNHGEGSRRDFLFYVTSVTGAVGLATATWPLIDSMNPAADILAISTIDIDLAPIQRGQRITVMWQGKPVFIDHRTPQQIAKAKADDGNLTLIDRATDASRIIRDEWLVVVGICTHLGCIPLGQRSGDPIGDWDGWFCPCHGSHYDTSGRIRKGPAPKNLVVPPYGFKENDVIEIG